jgi:hypothetical protein
MVDRLDQVVVDPCRVGLLPVLRLPIARNRDDDRVLAGLRPLESQGDLVAIHAGQSDVEQDEIRPLLEGPLDRLATLAGDLNLIAEDSQQPGHTFTGILVVLNDENPHRDLAIMELREHVILHSFLHTGAIRHFAMISGARVPSHDQART